MEYKNSKCLTYQVFKVTVIDEKPDPNISTFRPLDQRINSNIRYNSDGYIPCNGYVPCQVHTAQPYLDIYIYILHTMSKCLAKFHSENAM